LNVYIVDDEYGLCYNYCKVAADHPMFFESFRAKQASSRELHRLSYSRRGFQRFPSRAYVNPDCRPLVRAEAATERKSQFCWLWKVAKLKPLNGVHVQVAGHPSMDEVQNDFVFEPLMCRARRG
jgi:hypothetical protein